jgi:uncharacterized protein YukE
MKMTKPLRAAESALERSRCRQAEAESRLVTVAAAADLARAKLAEAADNGADDAALTKFESAVLAADRRAETLRSALETVEAELTEAERALAVAKDLEFRMALSSSMNALANDIAAAIPKFSAAMRELASHCERATAAAPPIGIGSSRELSDVLPRILSEVTPCAEAVIDELRRSAAAVANGTMPTKNLRLPMDGARG